MRVPGSNSATTVPVTGDEVVTEAWLNATQDIPSYAPLAARHSFNAAISGYNGRGTSLHKIRSLLKKLAANTQSVHGLVMADSTFVGYNGSTYTYADAIPRQFGKAVAGLLGASYVNGIEQAIKAQGFVGDTTALTGGFATGVGSYPHFLSCQGAGTAIWTSTDPGTSVEFYYSDLSTTNFSYQVDGGSTTNVTTNATTSIKKVTISGLPYRRHTIQINGITGAGNYVFIMGWRCWTPAANALHMHNMSLGGAFANNSGAVAGLNWSNTTTGSGGGLGFTAPATWAAAGITPDFGLICIGNNDVNSSVAALTIAQGIRNMKAYLPAGAPVLLVHPPRVSGSNATLFDQLGTQFFVLADEFDALYFDWNDWDATLTAYSADGLAGGDGIHPLRAEQYAVGRHLGGMVAEYNPVSLGVPVYEIATAAETLLPGTWYRNAYTGGVAAMTLPSTPYDGAVTVVENTNTVGQPALTVQRGGTDTIEGSTGTFTLLAGEFGEYTYRAATGTWFQRRWLYAATPGTSMRRDPAGRTQVATPAVAADVANKGYVDAFPLSKFTAVATSVTPTFTAVLGTNYQVDTNGGAGTVNLPAISSTLAGQQVAVTKYDLSNNPITITPFSGDKVNNALASIYLTVAYENTVLVSNGVDGWSYLLSGIADPSVLPNVAVSRDSAGRSKFADPSAAQDAATKNYVDTKFATASGASYATIMKLGVD